MDMKKKFKKFAMFYIVYFIVVVSIKYVCHMNDIDTDKFWMGGMTILSIIALACTGMLSIMKVPGDTMSHKSMASEDKSHLGGLVEVIFCILLMIPLLINLNY